MGEPRHALALWALFTLIPLPGLLLLRTDTDGRALAPRRDPAVEADRRVRQRFGLRDPLIVLVESRRPEGIFHPETLGKVQALTEALQAIPEVGPQGVMSLATEKRDRLIPGSHASFVPFLKPFPATPTQMAELREDLDSPAAAVFTGTLVSADRRATALLAGVGDRSEVDRHRVYERIAALVEPLAGGGDRIHLVGAPAAEALLGDHLLADLAVLVPLAMGLLAAVLWAGTRRLAAVALALGKAGLAVAWTFGVLGRLGIPVYLTLAVLPVVLTTMALADEVHLLLRFQRELGTGAGRRLAAERTMAALATPVVLGTITTAVGFLSFLGSTIESVRAFGLGAALGILWGLGFSLVATPALLASLPESWLGRPAGRRPPEAAGGLPAHSVLALRRPRLTLAGLALVTLLGGAGLLRLEVHDSWIESFARGSAFRRSTEIADRLLHGTHQLNLHLDFRAGRGGAAAEACAAPRVIAALGEFEAFLRRQPGVGGALGLHAQLASLAAFWNPRAARPDEALADPGEIRRLLNRYELSPGLDRRRQVVTDALDETVVTAFLRAANYRDTRALLERVEAFHRRRLAPLGAELSLAGDIAVSQATIPAVVRTQALAFPIALVGVFAVTALLYGSPRLAAWALLPIGASAVSLLGALGWLGVPLGVATSMFFSIALGLGVDSQSIHLLDGYRRLAAAGVADPAGAAVREVGPAILLNTAAVAGGFGLLAVSSVPPNAQLGLLVALSLALGGMLTVAGLGALLAVAPGRALP